jgi:hypothetical protein
MTTHFASQYGFEDAFYLRGDLLRPEFGKWDACDPVAHCILDLVEAQHELAHLYSNTATRGPYNEAAFAAVVKKRHAAGKRLMEALDKEGQ